MPKEQEPGIKREIDGKVYIIHVDHNSGAFYCDLSEQFVEGSRLSATVLKTLVEKLKRSVREKPIRIQGSLISDPFGGSYWQNSREVDLDAQPKQKEYYTPVMITGVHMGNGNVLYLRGDDTRPTQGGRSGRELSRPLSEAEQKEWVELCRADRKAGRAKDEWEAAHRLDLDTELAKARGEALPQAHAEHEEE